jgi:hypothetical protein
MNKQVIEYRFFGLYARERDVVYHGSINGLGKLGLFRGNLAAGRHSRRLKD